ncbi:serine hydrolase domain-containing protein [Aquimarina megaterium]|uniref:serine hydrolase domain-containing protein n=1 Tax=Aquimarina megaterium TaxID=1443666 RepID=UPI000943CF52|nr:serine hydrolase [Aquimarina megaterium]
MKNITRLLCLIILLITSISFAQQSDSPAPEATIAETKISFWDLPYLKEAFIDTTPTGRKDSLAIGELGANGGNKDMIIKLSQEIADSMHGLYDSMLITHKGMLLFESYYRRGRVNLASDQASAAKAYTSLALGRTIQLGYLKMADLDKPLVSFLKDLDPTKFVKGAEKITLHKALTMRGGLRISEEQRKEFEKNPSKLKGQGLVQTLLEHSAPITSTSQNYSYGNFNPSLVMQVIEAVVPGTAQDFIKNELLDKMGITNYRWRTGVSGLPEAGWRVSMTSRDMVKWGTLVINKGKWNGEQLISAKFLANATSNIIKPTEDWQPDSFNYGYFFYQTNIIVGDKSYDTTFAWGGGGQYIITVDELDLVVVITGHDREDTIMTQVSKVILPAFVKDQSSVLENPYLGQKPPGLIPEPFAPGMVTTEEWQWSGAFTPDLKEFYFIREVGETEEDKKMKFIVIQNKNNKWQESVISPREGEPFISPDGKTMHLGTRYKERTETGDWSKIKSLGVPFKDFPIMLLTASAKGTYVFDSMGEGILRYSRLIDGEREEPKQFGKEINTGKSNAHPFIAPDESYILWDGRRDSGYGNADIYISFQQQDGSWGEAINLGDKINTESSEAGAFVTPDGKYLFFNRNVGKTKPTDKYDDVDTFWVDAKIIEKLRPKS